MKLEILTGSRIGLSLGIFLTDPIGANIRGFFNSENGLKIGAKELILLILSCNSIYNLFCITVKPKYANNLKDI